MEAGLLQPFINQAPKRGMDNVVIVAVIQNMHPEKGGQTIGRVNHDPGACRTVPPKFAQRTRSADTVIDPCTYTQGVGIS